MSKAGRIGTLLAATAVAAGMTSAAMASPAVAAPHGPQGPQPVTNWVQSVRANVPTWVKVYYRTDMNICNVKITVNGGRNVSVGYPGNRTRFTSLSQDDSLRRGRVDYASVEVDARTVRPGIALLRSTISYDTCGWHARTMRTTTVLSLPVTRGVMPGNNHPGRPGNNHRADRATTTARAATTTARAATTTARAATTTRARTTRVMTRAVTCPAASRRRTPRPDIRRK